MTIQEKAKRIMEQAQVVTLASVDFNGYPRPVVMSKLGFDGHSVYISTGTSSEKTAHFNANPKAGLSIVAGHDSITYTGKIETVSDKIEKESLWQEWMKEHFTGGIDDPEYTVLKFTPLSATYWIDKEFVKEEL